MTKALRYGKRETADLRDWPTELSWIVTLLLGLGPGGRLLGDLPHEHEVDELLGQIWVDAVAGDEDAVEETGC